MNIAYVLEDAGLSGGARIVLEHCNRLAARKHHVTLFTVTASDPKAWFPLKGVNHIVTGSYSDLTRALTAYSGHKVATWWKTARPVADSGGNGFYLIQDIETSYITNPAECSEVLDTYDLPLIHITLGSWVTARFNDAHRIGIAIDHELYKPSGIKRKEKTALYCYRNHFLKGPELFLSSLQHLQGIDILTVGMHKPPNPRIRHKGILSDKALAELYNSASVFILTSTHEGFGLPALEAMACGCPVITTNADGNMEFCVDGLNCIVVNRDPKQLAKAITYVTSDQKLWQHLSIEGVATAKRYQWDTIIDKLESVFRKY